MSKKKKKHKKSNKEEKLFKKELNRIKTWEFVLLTKDIVEIAEKYYTNESFILMNKFLGKLEDNIIMIHLSNLIYKAKKSPEQYGLDRESHLKEIVNTVKEENGYETLFNCLSLIHNSIVTDAFGYAFGGQIRKEVRSIINMSLNYNKVIVGLDNGQPVIKTSRFPMNEYYVMNYIRAFNEYRDGKKNKGNSMALEQRVMRLYYEAYLFNTYGYYNSDTTDLIPRNILDIIEWNEGRRGIHTFPRTLYDDLESYGMYSIRLLNHIKQNRKYLLHKNGVIIDCYNAGDIDRIILYQTKKVLLYKVILKSKGYYINHKGNLSQDFSGGEYVGYIGNNVLYKNGTKDGAENALSIINSYETYREEICKPIENFILECYADLVCGKSNKSFDEKETVTSSEKVLYDPEINEVDIEKHFKENKMIGIRYMPLSQYREKNKRIARKTFQNSKEIYSVIGHLRKLPDGQSASDEAKNHALEYGIELPKGYTFVQPHFAGTEKVRLRYKKVVE